MNKLIRISAIATLMIATAPAHAAQDEHPQHSRDPGINARQHNQHERIDQGVRSGQPTHGEAQGSASRFEQDLQRYPRGDA